MNDCAPEEGVRLPRGRRLGDLPDILARLPRLAVDEAEAFARDVERSRAEIGGAPTEPPGE